MSIDQEKDYEVDSSDNCGPIANDDYERLKDTVALNLFAFEAFLAMYNEECTSSTYQHEVSYGWSLFLSSLNNRNSGLKHAWIELEQRLLQAVSQCMKEDQAPLYLAAFVSAMSVLGDADRDLLLDCVATEVGAERLVVDDFLAQ